jgi:hypothetical protein
MGIWQIYDAYPTKKIARKYAKDLRKSGYKGIRVRKIPPQGGYGGYLKYGIFTKDKRL